MDQNDDRNVIAHKQFMKITGLYYILNPNSLQLFGFNFFKMMAIFQMTSMHIIVFMCITSIYYCSKNINEVLNYILLISAYIFGVFKHYYLIKHSDTIWNCLQLTSFDFLSYKHHNKNILKKGQKLSRYITVFFFFLWLFLTISWILSPIFIKDSFTVKLKNESFQYRYNVLSFIYPITEKSYIDNFKMLYAFEVYLLICWVHTMFVFDFLIISMSIAIIYQFKTTAYSYSTFINIIRHKTSK